MKNSNNTILVKSKKISGFEFSFVKISDLLLIKAVYNKMHWLIKL